MIEQAPDRTPRARCARCNCPYGSHGFHDLIVPDEVWREISPTGDEGGLLCPTCILAAMDDLGMKNVPVYFASGPAMLEPTAELRAAWNRIDELLTWKEKV